MIRGAVPTFDLMIRVLSLFDLMIRGAVPTFHLMIRGDVPTFHLMIRGALPTFDLMIRGAVPTFDLMIRGAIPKFDDTPDYEIKSREGTPVPTFGCCSSHDQWCCSHIWVPSL